MKIKLFTIPNMLTLANLICGSLAVCTILSTGGYNFAFMMVVLAGVFDFFDGFVARLLGQNSAIGVELDSLADLVSFGLAPSLIMMSIFAESEKYITNPLWLKYGYYLPLIIVAFSSLRLAKFNIDTEQKTTFIGLPTPACALFCSSLGMLYAKGFTLTGECVVVLSVAMALLLISPIKMFALKFSNFKWRGNIIRYCFLIVAAALFLLLQLDSMPFIILLYIALSSVLHFVEEWNSAK
ncbi:MAG: CDP-diacylglycerol--serine O-phosphatidyltransferase [Rikenellaceae bacterium]